MIHIGIDPGADGAIAVLDENGKILYRAGYPKIGNKFDPHGLNKIIKKTKQKYPDHNFTLELIGIIFGVSKSSMVSLSKNCGQIEGILIGNECRHAMVPPKEWQKEMWKNIKPIRKASTKRKKDGTPAIGSVNTKATSLLAAKRLWPTEDFLRTERSTKPHDGIIDALLLAEYSRRKF